MTPPPRRPIPALEGAGQTLPANEALEASALARLLSRGKVRAALYMLGPAFVASIAYVDPGNFATNVQGGAEFGYLLLWVVLAANLVAMVIQYLSAKLGIVTDHDYPEVVREHFPRVFTWGMWVQAEIMAMSTDLAEFVGAAIGLNLLFGVPLLAAGLITGVIAFGILGLQARGFRRFELAISALLAIIFAGFLYETLRIGPSVHGSLRGLVPGIHGTSYLYIAVGIVGATVMPHVIYLHSALTKGRMPCRDDTEKKRVLRFERLDVYIALGLRRPRQPSHARRRRQALPHPGPVKPEHHPAGAHPDRAPRRRSCRARVRGRATRLRRLLLQRRHLRRPDRDRRLHQVPDTPGASPRDHDDPRASRTRHRN